MSDDVVIKVEGLGKKYRIRHQQQERYTALRDVLARKLSAPFRRLKEIGAGSLEQRAGRSEGKSGNPALEDFWALKDVSFEVNRGEVLGIIGRNGAGKSTLLKLLSRITEPTTGEVQIRGRVASLLEVGTGFHPELTGRENIFLNGAILGMSRLEIRNSFDEIVEFAEISQFLDTPVKRYSSGMYMRLAFAVAANLRPEILIVDEVLAVGDSAFQKKCLGKMKTLACSGGRTILFVSHNMTAVGTLCNRGLLMDAGKIKLWGDCQSTIRGYMSLSQFSNSEVRWKNENEAPGDENIRVLEVAVSPPGNEKAITIDTGATITLSFRSRLRGINLDCTFYVQNAEGILLFETGCIISSSDDLMAGYYRIKGDIPSHFLNAGTYWLTAVFGRDQRYPLLRLDQLVAFNVENTNTGRGRNMQVTAGVVRPLIHWNTQHGSSPGELSLFLD